MAVKLASGIAILFAVVSVCCFTPAKLEAGVPSSTEFSLPLFLIGEETVADNVPAVRREVASLRSEMRFERLSEWVLPGRIHADLRLTGAFTPQHASSSAATDPAFRTTADTSGIDTLLASGSRLVAPALDLVNLASQNSQLEILSRRIESWTPEKPQSQMRRAAFLALVDFRRGKMNSANNLVDRVHTMLRESDKNDLPSLWPATLIVHDACLRQASSKAVTDLLTYLHVNLAQQTKRSETDVWRTHINRLHGIRSLRQQSLSEGKSVTVASGGRIHFDQWLTTSRLTSQQSGNGQATALWSMDSDGNVQQWVGNETGYLVYRSPLLGNFTIDVDWAGFARGQLLYGGHYLGPMPSGLGVTAGMFGRPSVNKPLDEKIDHFGPWMHQRTKLSDGDKVSFINGRLVSQDIVSQVPWLGLQGSLSTGTQFRAVRISESATVPETVELLSHDQMAYWHRYFDETASPVERMDSADRPDDEVILSVDKHGALHGSALENLVQYFRPLVEDSRVEYEFFYAANECLASPALGRLAFVLTDQGVLEHRITDGRFDRTRLRPDNLTASTKSMRHGDSMPLEEGRWNRLRMELKGANVELHLNDQLVYARELPEQNQRTLGLFHFADQHALKVRNVRLTGDWPRDVPSVQELGDPIVHRLNARAERLEQVYHHDLGDPKANDRLIKQQIPGDGGSVEQTERGLIARVFSTSQWRQIAFSPQFSLHGDFDVQASLSDLSLPKGVKIARASLQIRFPGEPQRIFRSELNDNANSGAAAQGALQLRFPDGSVRYQSKRFPDESVSGRLRIARRGSKIFVLAAQGRSGHWRMLYEEDGTDGKIEIGAIQLLTIVTGPATTQATWESCSLRAESLGYAPVEQPVQRLTVFRSDGSKVRDLTEPTGESTTLGSPAWSPDGSKIAYDQSAGSVRSSRLMVVSRDGGQRQDIGYGSMPTFSPDGKRIAFSASGQGVGIMNADGTERRILDPQGWAIQWTPTNDWLSYSKRGNFYLWDLRRGSAATLLKGAAADRYSYLYWNASWSPDGKHIAFKGRRRDTGTDELAVVSVSRPDRVTLLLDEFKYGQIDGCWSSDGKQYIIPLKAAGSPLGRLQAFDFPSAPAKPGESSHSELTAAPPSHDIVGVDLSADGRWFAVAAKAMPTERPWPTESSAP